MGQSRHGGLLTTVEDLFLWDQNFYSPKVGNAAVISLLTTPGTLSNSMSIDDGKPQFAEVFGNRDRGISVKFSRGENGLITGFLLNTSRMKGLAFKKT